MARDDGAFCGDVGAGSDGVSAQPEVERRAREACAAGDFRGATTLLLRAYGTEILGFLRWRLRNDPLGDEAFSEFALDAWRGLPGFEWTSTAWTWLYTVSCRAAARVVRKQRRGAALPEDAGLSQLVEQVRSQTPAHLRSEAKLEVRRLRESLDEEDQVLLVLRVDREMSWREVSLVMGDEGVDENKRAAFEAKLRKRYQLLKERLRTLARASKLLPE